MGVMRAASYGGSNTVDGLRIREASTGIGVASAEERERET